MYGVDSAVLPEYRSRGVGSKLMDARFAVLKQLNLRGMIAGSLIIDYHKVASEVTPEQYVQDVIDGKRFDTNLTKQLHKGFRVHNIIPNYFNDARTLNYGVGIVWQNPDFDPSRPILRTAKVIPAHFDVRLKPERTPEATFGAVGN
ncbi:MAG: GNAT family N-acetyltransferase [Pleurocapsa minor GSE-CHR-MK-17-07R]|jgi:ribosomal protein S18 acetylase RimI-like enzyme|nr:GNAT family N-acetyltransferase [Pleurocapsa minor GSE-CHR-MK 17-07R]